MIMTNGMFNGVSSRTTSVSTSHFYGHDKPSTTTPSDFIPEGAPFTYKQSYYPSFGFLNKCSSQIWGKGKGGLTEHVVTPYFVPEGYIISTARKNLLVPGIDLAYDGKPTLTPVEDIFNPLDRKQDRIGRWREQTEQCNTVEYVKKPTGKSGLYEGQRFIHDYSEHCPSMTKVNVPIASWSGVNVDINKVGAGFSRIANTYNDLRDVIFYDYPKRPRRNSETEAVLESLISKGKGPAREINAIGVENLEKAIALTYMTNGTASLVASADIYQKALKIAEGNGLKGEEAVRFAKRMVWYHEFYHVFDHRKFVSRGKKEIDVGEFLAELFTKRAGIVDEKTAIIYRKLAEYNKDYAKGWRKGGIKNLIESLAKQYASEAQAMGMSEEKARDYVANKLEKEIEKSEKSDLEERVDKESKENEDGENKAEVAENKEYSGKTDDRDAQEQAKGQEATNEALSE